MLHVPDVTKDFIVAHIVSSTSSEEVVTGFEA